MKSVFSLYALILSLTGFMPYLHATIQGEAKPAKVTWLIWAVLDIIVLSGMYAENSLNGQIIGATSGSVIMAGFSLKYGVPGWTKLDKFCGAGALTGIILWQISGNAVQGIIASLCVMSVGAIPTFVSAWKEPRSENRLAWIIFESACIFSLLAMPAWTLQDSAAPVVFFSINSVMLCILFMRK